MKTRPAEQWEQVLKANDVPCSPVNTIDKVVVQPQVLAAQMIQHIELSGLGMMSMPGLPIKFSETPGAIRLAPPRLGEHTRVVLQEVGYRADEIEQMASTGVIEFDHGWAAAKSG
jgi:crotonobetainyl-CoA:carnitine CoA-transferase CaiB-like acyl-CoA transferase